MKVYEILSENHDLNESVKDKFFTALGLRIVERLAAKGATKKLIEHWADELAAGATKLAPDVAGDFLKKQGLKPETVTRLTADSKFLTSVEKDAAKLLEKRKWELAKTGYAAAWGTTWKVFYYSALAWGVGEPIYRCAKNIEDAYARHNAKQGEIADPQVLQHTVQHHINICVGEVAAIFIGTKVIKGVFGASGVQQLPFLGGERISALFNTASAASRAAFVVWLGTDAGNRAFAEWITGAGLLSTPLKFVRDTAGILVKTGVDKIIKLFNPTASVDGTDGPQLGPDGKPIDPATNLRDVLPKGAMGYDWNKERAARTSPPPAQPAR
jgi:hypothetical protein